MPQLSGCQGTNLSSDCSPCLCYSTDMSIRAAFLRIALVVTVLIGSAPQMMLATDQAKSVHAAMMSMSQTDMASETEKSQIDYCKRHCLAVVAVVPEMQVSVFESKPVFQMNPPVDILWVSLSITPTGPPPKVKAS